VLARYEAARGRYRTTVLASLRGAARGADIRAAIEELRAAQAAALDRRSDAAVAASPLQHARSRRAAGLTLGAALRVIAVGVLLVALVVAGWSRRSGWAMGTLVGVDLVVGGATRTSRCGRRAGGSVPQLRPADARRAGLCRSSRQAVLAPDIREPSPSP
jgi:hypothetical protein